jgi:hypothetical protein
MKSKDLQEMTIGLANRRLQPLGHVSGRARVSMPEACCIDKRGRGAGARLAVGTGQAGDGVQARKFHRGCGSSRSPRRGERPFASRRLSKCFATRRWREMA